MRYLEIVGAAVLFLVAGSVVVAGEDLDVKITGPEQVDSGGFALVGECNDESAVLRWRIDAPDGAVPPLELLDARGRPVLVFMNPITGTYKAVLTAQVPQDGLDPFGEMVHQTKVGKGPAPEPEPDDPDEPDDPEPEPDKPDPEPELTGTAKAVFEAGKSADAQTLGTMSDLFSKQIVLIQNGALSGTPIGAAISRMIRDIHTGSPPRERAVGLFDVMESELQRRDDGGDMETIEGVLEVFLDIKEGLEAARKAVK